MSDRRPLKSVTPIAPAEAGTDAEIEYEWLRPYPARHRAMLAEMGVPTNCHEHAREINYRLIKLVQQDSLRDFYLEREFIFMELLGYVPEPGA